MRIICFNLNDFSLPLAIPQIKISEGFTEPEKIEEFNELLRFLKEEIACSDPQSCKFYCGSEAG